MVFLKNSCFIDSNRYNTQVMWRGLEISFKLPTPLGDGNLIFFKTMNKSINIYRGDDGELACTFFPLRPIEEVLRTVVVNDAYVKQIETATLERVRDLLDYLLKS